MTGILDLIDGAIADWETTEPWEQRSPDAMHWTANDDQRQAASDDEDGDAADDDNLSTARVSDFTGWSTPGSRPASTPADCVVRLTGGDGTTHHLPFTRYTIETAPPEPGGNPARLFVGGPMHGQIHAVPPGATAWQTHTLEQPPWASLLTVTPTLTTYHRQNVIVAGPAGNRRVDVMTPTGADHQYLIHALAVAAGLIAEQG
jgi:hypothetical protein